MLDDRDYGEVRWVAIGTIGKIVALVVYTEETVAYGSFQHGRLTPMTRQTTTQSRHDEERQSGDVPREEASSLAVTQTDWARLEAMTDEEALQNALDDPDSQPLTPEQRSRLRRVPNPKAIRLAMGLSQEAFARRFEIAVGTLRDWEQGAHIPDSTAKAYLRVIEADPDAVVQALARSRRGHVSDPV